MKRKTMVLMMVFVLSFMFCCGATGEDDLIGIIRNAQKIQWASKDYVALDGKMIRVSDGEILFDSINSIFSTGGYVCISTDDGIWVLDRDGNRRHPEPGSDYFQPACFDGKYGLFFGCDNNNSDACWFVYDPAMNTITKLPGFEGDDHIEDIYQDSEGQVYILTADSSYSTCGIYKANGEQILEKDKYSIAFNHNGDPITNEYLPVCFSEGIGVLSPFTGEVIWTLDDCYWPLYDSVSLIYSDNISIAENENGRMIVGLDGTILSRIFCNDCPYQESVYGGFGENYNVLTDRTYVEEESDGVQYITCKETGEIFKETEDGNAEVKKYKSLESGKILSEDEILDSGEIIPERYEKYKPVSAREIYVRYTDEGIEIVSPEGTVLGNRHWDWFADGWDLWRGDISDKAVFLDATVWGMQDRNGLCTVINTKGDIVLPAEYDWTELIGSFSEDPKANGHCLAAKKNGLWYVFDEQGEPLFSDLDVHSGEKATAAAAKVYTSGDYEYTLLEDNTAEIEGYTGKDTELIIPSEIDGKKITSLGIDSFTRNVNLTSVAVPDSVTNICDNAFSYCRSLASIIIPNSVNSIGNAVFYKCEKLNSITIPGSITSMGDRVFCDCGELQSVVIPEGVERIGSYTFSGCKKLKFVLMPGSLTAIENNALENCENLKSVTIPNGVTSIGEGAFCGCSSLMSVTIPKSLTSISWRTFYNCSSLTSVTIPEGVTNIGDDAFRGCKNLESVTIPDSVTLIGKNAFEACNKLTFTVSENSYAAGYGAENDFDIDIFPMPQPVEATDDEGSAGTAGNDLPEIGEVAVGNVITFGTYPQTDEGTDQTPIEWMVLDVKDGKALLLSKYGLDAKAYNRRWHEDVTWENCSLRKWLNNEFLKKAFSSQARSVIVITDVDNSANQGYVTKAFYGKDTKDQVFLLSYAEANKYLNITYDDSDNMKSRVTPTAYAKSQGAWTSSVDKTDADHEAGWWWLRSPGFWRGNSSRVAPDGVLNCYGSVNEDNVIVRPALWINLESDLWIEGKTGTTTMASEIGQAEETEKSRQVKESASVIPDFSELYPAQEIKLRRLGGSEKTTLFSGPGVSYMTIRKINPREKNTTTAFFIENDMVYVHYFHRLIDTYGYIKRGAAMPESLTEIPEISELQYVEKKIKEETVPLTGPGDFFEKWKGPSIPENSEVRCYFTVGNYCFVEYEFEKGYARVWVRNQGLF